MEEKFKARRELEGRALDDEMTLGLEAGVAVGILLVSDVLVVCHLSRMFLSSVGATAVSNVMSTEFLCELLVSAVLSRMLVPGIVFPLCMILCQLCLVFCQ